MLYFKMTSYISTVWCNNIFAYQYIRFESQTCRLCTVINIIENTVEAILCVM